MTTQSQYIEIIKKIIKHEQTAREICFKIKYFISKELQKQNVASQKVENFLDTCLKENVTVAVNKTDSTRQVVWAEDCLALKALGQDKRYPVINFIHTLLETWLENELKKLELSHAH